MSSKAEVRHFRSASARQRHDCEAIRYHGTHFDAGFHADDGYLLGIVVQRGLRLEFTITSGAIEGPDVIAPGGYRGACIGMQDFSQAKTIWSLAEWEPDDARRQSLLLEVIEKLERALSSPLDKQMQAACHNIAGQCYMKLGQETEACAAFESALKLNKNMRQTRKHLDLVNARSAAKARAAQLARQKRNRQLYCCYIFPRCSRGPCKPEVVRPVLADVCVYQLAQLHLKFTRALRRTLVGQLLRSCSKRRTC